MDHRNEFKEYIDMNWGNRIVVVFICFAAFIGYMVVRAFQEDFDLVAEDYYAQEIGYQSKLNKLSNASRDSVSVGIHQQKGDVYLEFPRLATGKIHFYHPSRKMFDRTFDIQLDKSNLQRIAKSDLVPGNYRVNISWNTDSKEYYQQTNIYIQ